MKKSYFKTSDNAYIYFEDSGEGDIALVFVPGHMCTTKFYKKNVEYFEKKYRVITFDNRGFGSSSKPLHGNNVERNAEDIKELIEYLGLKKVVLLGWSLSGSIVMTYAHKYYDKGLIGLGIIDACLFPFSPDDWNTYNSRNYNMDDWNEKYELWHMDIKKYIDNFVSRIKDGLTDEETAMVKKEIAKTPPWIGFALHSDWCHTDATEYLDSLKIPVIIFSGESKGHGYKMGRYYKSRIKTYCELHEFSKGGHILFYLESEKFNSLLETFINKIK